MSPAFPQLACRPPRSTPLVGARLAGSTLRFAAVLVVLIGCGDSNASSSGGAGGGVSGPTAATGPGPSGSTSGTGATATSTTVNAATSSSGAGIGGDDGIGGSPGGSPLADLAASMPAGSWTQMTPTPQGLELFVGGEHSGIKTGYATKMAYDPTGRRLFFLGCDHNQEQSFLLYDEATNAWTAQQPAPFNAPTKHGYEHSTWDTVHNALWHRPYHTRGAYRWDGGGSWTFVDYSSALDYESAANGFEFFPELGQNGSLVAFQLENGTEGEVIGIDPITQAITSYASGAALAGAGDPHNFARYNPVSQVVWFGGGNGSAHTWRLDASGNVAPMTDAPASIGTLGPGTGNALPVANPKNGRFLVFHSATEWYDFDPSGAGTWTPLSGTAEPWTDHVFDTSDAVWGTVAATLHAYDVVVMIKAYSREAPAEMWLYKP